MQSFLDVIKDDTDFLAKIAKGLETKSFKKGTLLQHKGDTVKHTYFVKKGILRSYTIDEKGKEHIFMFASEGWIISDIESVISTVPSQLYIDTVTDCEVEVLTQSGSEESKYLQKLTNQIGNDKLFKRIAVLQRRVIMLMSASALERYNHFLDTYPDLVQRVPQRMIASYLGITPEGLSKIRNTKAKSK